MRGLIPAFAALGTRRETVPLIGGTPRREGDAGHRVRSHERLRFSAFRN